MKDQKSDYDERVLSRSRVKNLEPGKPYVDWSKWVEVKAWGNWVVLGLAILDGLIIYAITLLW